MKYLLLRQLERILRQAQGQEHRIRLLKLFASNACPTPNQGRHWGLPLHWRERYLRSSWAVRANVFGIHPPKMTDNTRRSSCRSD